MYFLDFGGLTTNFLNKTLGRKPYMNAVITALSSLSGTLGLAL